MTTTERVGLIWGRAAVLAATFLLVASIVACERREASLPSLPGFENIRAPVRIVDAFFYADGGTCSAELRDAAGKRFYVGFDGRMRWDDSSWPYHCFVGAAHPEPGARMLSLWGPEERAMIAIASAAIDATLSPGQRAAILRAAPKGEPKGVDWEVARFVMSVQRRLETLEAMDNGELEGLDATLVYFNARAPLAVERITEESDASGFDVTVADRDGKKWQVSLPSSMDSASVLTTARYRLRSRTGSHIDRMMLTLLSHALGNPTPPTDTTRSSLVLRIDQRKARILSDDRAR